jgi:DNA-binding transcriptional LysR family regulator
MQALSREAPGLRCELAEAEPEWSLPALAIGDVDLVLADEWEHQPLARLDGLAREDILRDPVHVVLPADHPVLGRHDDGVPLAELEGEAWTSGHHDTAWKSMIERTCRELGRFEPDIRHRTNDAVLSMALVAGGQAVTLLPALVDPGSHPGIAVRPIAEGAVYRKILMATRAADAERPSVQALRAAIRAAAVDVSAKLLAEDLTGDTEAR